MIKPKKELQDWLYPDKIAISDTTRHWAGPEDSDRSKE